MRENLEYILSVTTRMEGGYVNNPNDKGGPTNHGITIGTLSGVLGRPATVADVKALTKAQAIDILKKGYYDKVWGDKLPAGLDLSMTDFATNSGPSRPNKEIQKLVGVAEDGIMGQITLNAILAQDPYQLNEKLNAARMTYLKGLKGKSGFPTFGRGWTIRVTGKDPKGQWKQQPGIMSMSRDLIAKRKLVIVNPPEVVTQAGKATDASRGVASTKTGKAITLAGVGGIVAAGLQYLPSIIDFAVAAPDYAEKLSSIAWISPKIGIAVQILTAIGTVGAMFANRGRDRASGFDYQGDADPTPSRPTIFGIPLPG